MVRPDYTTSELQRYIKYARTIKPTLGDEAARQLGARWDAPRTPRTASARPTPPPPHPAPPHHRSPPSAVRFYRELRQEDEAKADASSYRVTVRQLEAMIRLGEDARARARPHSSSSPTPPSPYRRARAPTSRR